MTINAGDPGTTLEPAFEPLTEDSERTPEERRAALDHLFARLAEIAKDANPNFVWNRDLAYDFDDEE